MGSAESHADREWWDNFRDLLDEHHDWPADYTFKFIVPKEQVDEVKAVLGDVPLTIRASSRGTYHSVTAVLRVHSADDVVAVYDAASGIEGVVSL